MRGMDWVRARVLLREKRFQLDLGVNDLATKAKVSRQVVYHSENLKDEPDYEPDFTSLEKMALAMGYKLSEFFAQVEGGSAQPGNGVNRAEPQPNVSPTVPAETEVPQSDVIIAVGEAIAESIEQGFNRLIASVQQSGRAQSRKTARGADHRKTNRSAASSAR